MRNRAKQFVIVGLCFWSSVLWVWGQSLPIPMPIQLPTNSPYIQDFNNTPGDSGILYPSGWIAFNGRIPNPVLLPGTWLTMLSGTYNYGGKIGMLGDSISNNPGYFVLALCNTAECAEMTISYDVVKQWEALFANSRLVLEYSIDSPISGFKLVQGTTYDSRFRLPNSVKKYLNISLPREVQRRRRNIWLRWKYSVTSNALFSKNHDGIAIDNVRIDWIPATPLIDLGNDTTICPGGFTQLDASVIPGDPDPIFPDLICGQLPGIHEVSYLWSTGETTPKITVNAPGTYWVAATNVNGATYDTIQVIEKPFIVSLGNDTTVCGGMMLDAGSPGSVYIWNTSEATQRVWVDKTHWYHVRVITPGGCINEDSVFVTVMPPIEFDLGSNYQVCQGEPVLLEAPFDSAYHYLWSTGDTTNTIEVTAQGQYWVEITTNTCTIRDSVSISHVSLEMNLGEDRELCVNEPLFVGGTFSRYLWSDGSSLPWLYPSQSGTYSLTVTNESGCQISDTIAVTIHHNSPVGLIAPDTVVVGQEVVFRVNTVSPVESWYWNFGNGTFTVLPDSASTTYNQPGDYLLQLILDDGVCNDTITKTIHVQSSVFRSGDISYQFKIYPNPVTEILNIQIFPLPEKAIVKILDINGKVWTTSNFVNSENIDVSNLPLGVYVIETVAENRTILVSRFVKL